MKPNTISLRRRQLMIAGVAGAAAPATLFAAQCAGVASGAPGLPTFGELVTSRTEERLIISGRVVGSDCKPISGARVEVWYSDPKDMTTATTDADGRFMVDTLAPTGGRSSAFKISVSLPDGRTLTAERHFRREPGVADEALVQVHRDEAGLWRTTLGLTFA